MEQKSKEETICKEFFALIGIAKLGAKRPDMSFLSYSMIFGILSKFYIVLFALYLSWETVVVLALPHFLGIWDFGWV